MAAFGYLPVPLCRTSIGNPRAGGGFQHPTIPAPMAQGNQAIPEGHWPNADAGYSLATSQPYRQAPDSSTIVKTNTNSFLFIRC